jgi:diphthine-ammonia ligase
LGKISPPKPFNSVPTKESATPPPTTMSESLSVIALISGGKDSFFSLLHCIRNGHKVIALGNLHPPILEPTHLAGQDTSSADDENDLNSFMYQTVGHTVIPLYEEALGIPLYRQAITGTAVQTGTSYSHASIMGSQDQSSGEDETESLVPLLKRIIQAHPEANALSTGAILSTYQRTRIESVALRLGLTPLSFLWQYPVLPPATQISLLQDMQAAGLDARIIKVASGGLDEGFLWENVASMKGMARVERAMRRFGMVGDGAVLGEGGEFETLVVDGPRKLFKKRIVIEESDRRIVREGGGAAWLQIKEARLVDKDEAEEEVVECRISGLLDQRSEMILTRLREDSMLNNTSPEDAMESQSPAAWTLNSSDAEALQHGKVMHWTIMADKQSQGLSIPEEAKNVVENIRSCLEKSSLSTTDIVSTVIILRNMSDFTTINQVCLP